MLRNNHVTESRSPSTLPFSPPPAGPLQLPTEVAPSHIDTDDISTSIGSSALLIAQLNCFNGKNITLNILANKDYSILLLQEPWIDPHTFQLPPHPAWHDFTPYDYAAKSYNERPRTGIYVTKRIPSWLINILPSKSALLTAVEVELPNSNISKLRAVAAYNPPTHNTGLPVLRNWLQTHNERKTATIIGIDRNLHHPKWNPLNYRHTHPLAKELIKVCGSAGFQVTSQKHVPTFYSRTSTTRPTTIDLT